MNERTNQACEFGSSTTRGGSAGVSAPDEGVAVQARLPPQQRRIVLSSFQCPRTAGEIALLSRDLVLIARGLQTPDALAVYDSSPTHLPPHQQHLSGSFGDPIVL
eukprot:GHVU01102537.1.p1 GENE.GHVU01102537.1~~GHVU01102537.1.p1  ORF type:complete len:105 (+),score=14.05 GHVU01102537.1:76-390(+)